MPACCVKQCGARRDKDQPNLTLHRFPTIEIWKKQWIENIGLENINHNQKELFICSKHFDPCFLNGANKRLHVSAVPFALHKPSQTRTNVSPETQLLNAMASSLSQLPCPPPSPTPPINSVPVPAPGVPIVTTTKRIIKIERINAENGALVNRTTVAVPVQVLPSTPTTKIIKIVKTSGNDDGLPNRTTVAVPWPVQNQTGGTPHLLLSIDPMQSSTHSTNKRKINDDLANRTNINIPQAVQNQTDASPKLLLSINPKFVSPNRRSPSPSHSSRASTPDSTVSTSRTASPVNPECNSDVDPLANMENAQQYCKIEKLKRRREFLRKKIRALRQMLSRREKTLAMYNEKANLIRKKIKEGKIYEYLVLEEISS